MEVFEKLDTSKLKRAQIKVYKNQTHPVYDKFKTA